MTLTDFLLARIVEDEAAARDQPEWARVTSGGPMACLGEDSRLETTFARVLAECEAKRRIVELFPNHPDHSDGWGNAGGRVLELLALPYADHADYREDEWRP